MKLYVVESYRNRNTEYPKGSVIEVSEEEGKFLLRDAPGCFSKRPPKPEPEPEAEKKELDAPPADKMLDGEDAVTK